MPKCGRYSLSDNEVIIVRKEADAHSWRKIALGAMLTCRNCELAFPLAGLIAAA